MLLTVGYPSRQKAEAQVGKWRAELLRSLMRGYLDSNLRTTNYFRNLEQSEKAAMTFLIAQAFTGWFAQKYLGASYVMHVRGASEQHTPTVLPGGSTKGTAKPKPRSRPDFLGKLAHGHHVLESKGSSRSVGSAIQSALAQASMIATINGSKPILRVAMGFAITANGVTATIVDPEGDRKGFDLTFDEVRAAQKAYTLFLDPEIRPNLSERIPGFRCVELEDGLIYGIDNAVLSALDELGSSTVDEKSSGAERVLSLLNIIQERLPHYKDHVDSETSIGNDGIILRGSTTRQVMRRR